MRGSGRATRAQCHNLGASRCQLAASHCQRDNILTHFVVLFLFFCNIFYPPPVTPGACPLAINAFSFACSAQPRERVHSEGPNPAYPRRRRHPQPGLCLKNTSHSSFAGFWVFAFLFFYFSLSISFLTREKARHLSFWHKGFINNVRKTPDGHRSQHVNGRLRGHSYCVGA